MNITSGPPLASRQPNFFSAAAQSGFFNASTSTNPTFGGNDPMSSSMAMMGLCMQCMTQMMHIMAMTMGGQGVSGMPAFGGSAGSSPGVDGFLGGAASPGSASGTSAASSSAPASQSGEAAQTSPAPDWASKLPEPLRKLGPVFEKYGKQYNVDPRFLAAISMLETGNGTSSAFRNKNNAMGVSDSKGPIGFSSVEQSIERMARVLASATGPYKGARTINEIGKVYAPVGAGNDLNGTNGHWPTGVSKFYQQLGGDPSKPVK